MTRLKRSSRLILSRSHVRALELLESRVLLDATVVSAQYWGTAQSDTSRGLALDSAGSRFISGTSTGGASLTKIATSGPSWTSYTTSGTTLNSGSAVAIDSADNAYLAGVYFDNTSAIDALLAKYNTAGQRLWYVTLHGGTAAAEQGYGVAVDPTDDSVVLCGYADNIAFPAPPDDSGLSAAFISKYSSAGVLQWTRVFGGSKNETAYAIDIDATGSIFIAGESFSTNMPAATNTAQGGSDGFVAKFNSAGTLQWSTYIGGSSNDFARALTLDPDGNLILAGESASINLLSAINAKHGSTDGFLAKINPSGTLLWTSYVGGTGADSAAALALDNIGDIVVAVDSSSTNFEGAANSSYGARDVVVARFSNAGVVQTALYAGGSGNDNAGGIVITSAARIYLSGYTASTNFVAATNAPLGSLDTFIARIDGLALNVPPTDMNVVYVSSSSWSSAFLNHLADDQLGSATFGFRVSNGAQQLTPIPWTNVDQISITFSADVTLDQSALSLAGINVPAYSFSNFAYDSASHTATWTLAAPISADTLTLTINAAAVTDAGNNPLDGEWTDAVSTTSGNGNSGGNFQMHLNFLPADGDGDGDVDGADFDTWYTHLQLSTFNPALGDFNADGQVDGADFDQWFIHLQSSLPTPLQSTPSLLAAAATSPTTGLSTQDPGLLTDDVQTHKSKIETRKLKIKPILVSKRQHRP